MNDKIIRIKKCKDCLNFVESHNYMKNYDFIRCVNGAYYLREDKHDDYKKWYHAIVTKGIIPPKCPLENIPSTEFLKTNLFCFIEKLDEWDQKNNNEINSDDLD